MEQRGCTEGGTWLAYEEKPQRKVESKGDGSKKERMKQRGTFMDCNRGRRVSEEWKSKEWRVSEEWKSKE